MTLSIYLHIWSPTMQEAKAFAPSHITGLFQIMDQPKDPSHAGSRGAGVSLTRGVKTTVKIEKAQQGSITISINGAISGSARVSQAVADAYVSRAETTEQLAVSVEHEVDVPIGVGLGTSGAAALSLSIALNQALDTGLSNNEAAQIAHVAEVKCGTGLGTVMAETHGGLEIRVTPGAPGIGEVRRMVAPDSMMVACIVYGPLSTRKILADPVIRGRINEVGGKFVDQLVERADVAHFMKLSRCFAEHVDLFTGKVRQTLDEIDRAGFVCSMPMFGEAVFTLIEKERIGQLLKVFRRFEGGKIIIADVDSAGARLL